MKKRSILTTFLVVVPALVIALLLGAAQPAEAMDLLSPITWAISLFVTRPEPIVTSVATYMIRQEVPAEVRAQYSLFRDVPYLWAKSQGEGGLYQLIQGWKTVLYVFFPTRGRQPTRAYATVDNVRKDLDIINAGQEYSQEIQTDDSGSPHSIELGIDLSHNGGGSTNFSYATTPLSSVVPEHLANENFGQVALEAWQKAQPPPAVVAPTPSPVVSPPRYLIAEKRTTTSFTLDVEGRGEFAIFNNGERLHFDINNDGVMEDTIVVTGRREFPVAPGTVEVRATAGQWVAYPHTLAKVAEGETVTITLKGGDAR